MKLTISIEMNDPHKVGGETIFTRTVGALTDEHSASSYGLPVVLDAGGNVLDPAAIHCIDDEGLPEISDPAEFEFVRSADRAGYPVNALRFGLDLENSWPR